MIGVIVNPNALGVRKRPGLADRLARLVGAHGVVVQTRAPDELVEVAARFQKDGVDLVATCGGDGTNLATITQMARAYGPDRIPTFVLLRGGTVNTVAQNLGITGEPDRILARVVRTLERNDELPIFGQDLLEVNGMFGFLFAAAMGARFLEAYYDGPEPGHAWAAALAARTVVSSLINGPFARWLFSPVPLELEVDGRAPDFPHPRLLVASTVPDVGIGMKVAWRAGRQPARFHLVASALPTTRMALQLHRVLRGQPLAGGPHLDTMAKEARIRFAQPETYTLDGDLFRDTSVHVRVGARMWIARP
jgi:diacylglycerol kinase family enzyme